MLIALGCALAVLTANVWLLASTLKAQRQSTDEHAFWALSQPGHTPPERASAFQRLVLAGNREWRSAQLANLDFRGISLSKCDLKLAAFNGANLAHADLRGAILTKTTLTLTDLTGADLTEADLSETSAFRAIFKDARLIRAKARAAILQEVHAEHAQLLAADLSEADCLMANFTGADLAGANLTAARLEGAIFKGANLSLARLNGASIKDADFGNSNWWHARGFTTSQLRELREKFAPGTNAPAALKEDYAKWEAKP